MLRELCGDAALKNVVLVTNMWGEVAPAVGEAREKELSDNFFKSVLEKDAQMDRHHDTVQSAHGVIQKIMGKPSVVLRIQEELVDQGKGIIDTAAGQALNHELNEQMRRDEAELKVVQEEMAQALEKKDEETRQELEEERKKLEERMEKVKKDSEEMAATYAAEKERAEDKARQMARGPDGLRNVVGPQVTIPIYR